MTEAEIIAAIPSEPLQLPIEQGVGIALFIACVLTLIWIGGME